MEAVALHDFNPQSANEDELPFNKGSILKVRTYSVLINFYISYAL